MFLGTVGMFLGTVGMFLGTCGDVLGNRWGCAWEQVGACIWERVGVSEGTGDSSRQLQVGL